MKNKREKIALGLFIFGAIWWFVETWYFGWHLHAQSSLEGFCDFMVWVFWGLAFFIRPTRIEITNYNVGKGTFNLLGKTNIGNKHSDSLTKKKI